MEDVSTRDRLIDAGIQSMLSKSYHGVGIAEILADAGVPKGSFYHYFRSKEDFGAEVIRRYWATARDFMTKMFQDTSKTPMQRLEGYFRWGIDQQLQSGCRQGCLLAKLGTEVSDCSSLLRRELKESTDQWLELLARGIQEAQDSGELSPAFEPEKLALFLFGAWEGAGMRMVILQDRAPLDNFVELVFGGMLAP